MMGISLQHHYVHCVAHLRWVNVSGCIACIGVSARHHLLSPQILVCDGLPLLFPIMSHNVCITLQYKSVLLGLVLARGSLHLLKYLASTVQCPVARFLAHPLL